MCVCPDTTGNTTSCSLSPPLPHWIQKYTLYTPTTIESAIGIFLLFELVKSTFCFHSSSRVMANGRIDNQPWLLPPPCTGDINKTCRPPSVEVGKGCLSFQYEQCISTQTAHTHHNLGRVKKLFYTAASQKSLTSSSSFGFGLVVTLTLEPGSTMPHGKKRPTLFTHRQNEREYKTKRSKEGRIMARRIGARNVNVYAIRFLDAVDRVPYRSVHQHTMHFYVSSF